MEAPTSASEFYRAQGPQHLTNLGQCPLYFCCGDHIGRHEIDDVSQRAQEQAAIEGRLAQAWTDGIEEAGIGRFQFYDAYAAVDAQRTLPTLRDTWQLLEGDCAVRSASRRLRDPVVEGLAVLTAWTAVGGSDLRQLTP